MTTENISSMVNRALRPFWNRVINVFIFSIFILCAPFAAFSVLLAPRCAPAGTGNPGGAHRENKEKIKMDLSIHEMKAGQLPAGAGNLRRGRGPCGPGRMPHT